MKSILFRAKLLLIMNLIFHNLVSQNDVYEIKYSIITQLTNKGLSGEYSMLFDNTSSIFKNKSLPTDDKIVDDGSNNLFVISGDPDGFPIYQNLKDNILESKYYIGKKSNKCIIKENLPKISWKILNEVKLISSIKVNKAIGTFGGRIYEVWFAPSLSTQLGPFFLNGLPGLIIEAKSLDDKVKIEFLSLKKLEGVNKIQPLSKTFKLITLTYDDYIIKRNQVYEKIKIDVESRGAKFSVDSSSDSQIWKGHF